MSKKYRLVRTAPGVLDLSQVLDDQGRPVLLRALNDFAVVNEATAQHPLVKRFVDAGIRVEEVSLTPGSVPAVPVVDKVTAPPKPAPAPAPEPKVFVPEAPPPKVEEPPVPEATPEGEADVAAPAPEDTTVDEAKPSKKSSRKYGR